MCMRCRLLPRRTHYAALARFERWIGSAFVVRMYPGLESIGKVLVVDLRFLSRNWKIAAGVSLVGMVVPFGLGCAIAWGLYNEFRHEPGTVPISLGVYMLFIGVAMAITVRQQSCSVFQL